MDENYVHLLYSALFMNEVHVMNLDVSDELTQLFNQHKSKYTFDAC